MVENRLQKLKRLGLAAFRQTGTLDLVKESRWRGRRLVILCYHGVSIDEEHRWRPRLYVSQDLFRRRLELLRDEGFRVLPFDEALSRLYEGSLPERSVALTFDDGFHDFRSRAYPVIQEFGYPVTVYLTTYYCLKRRPVAPLLCDYVLWRSAGKRVEQLDLMGESFDLDLRTGEGRKRAREQLLRFGDRRRLSDSQKQELIKELADALHVDYDSIIERGLVHLLSPDEVEELAREGVDFQLHMHRHRSPLDEDAYREEVRENRQAIHSLTGEMPSHFCYPSGASRPRFARWLEREGVDSATTDRVGVASARSDRMFLPRLLDHSGLSDTEFLAWTTGLAHWLPRRSE